MTRRSLNHKMFDSEDISITATSSKSNVDGIDQAAVVISWSGTAPVGVVTFESSNSDAKDFQNNNEVWEELDFGLAVIAVSGATGSHQVVFNALPFKWLRIKYTSTSGIGSIIAHLNATSVGA